MLPLQKKCVIHNTQYAVKKAGSAWLLFGCVQAPNGAHIEKHKTPRKLLNRPFYNTIDSHK